MVVGVGGGGSQVRQAFIQNWRFSMPIWMYLGTSNCDAHCVVVSLSQRGCVQNKKNKTFNSCLAGQPTIQRFSLRSL